LTTPAAATVPVLVLDTLSRTCTLPLADVVEILRPLPVVTVPGAPAFVRGVAVIRGEPVPVVDLALLLAGRSSEAVRRFVVLRSGQRRVALAVDGVQGKLELDPRRLRSLPSLVGETSSEVVKAVGLVDDRLLTALEAGRQLVDEAWRAVEGGKGAP
jgi:purine-binding chemotaxis protein CheW